MIGKDQIALPLVAGTGSTLTVIDPAAITSQRFYRVIWNRNAP